MIAIIGAAGANLASVFNAFERLGKRTRITNDPDLIASASHVIIPGVGTAAQGMLRLSDLSLTPLIKELTQPVLGICLGMQLMASESEEGGQVECLGLINAPVRALATQSGLPIPHMGWNQLHGVDGNCPLFRGIEDNDYYYFVHSFAFGINSWTKAASIYGDTFSAAVQKDNFFGVQFHPERSGKSGSKLLRNFSEL